MVLQHLRRVTPVQPLINLEVVSFVTRVDADIFNSCHLNFFVFGDGAVKKLDDSFFLFIQELDLSIKLANVFIFGVHHAIDEASVFTSFKLFLLILDELVSFFDQFFKLLFILTPEISHFFVRFYNLFLRVLLHLIMIVLD